MFRTPNLHTFSVTWFLKPSQFPDFGKTGLEEFLTERFIDDLMDDNSSIPLVVEETQTPEAFDPTSLREVAVVLKVITTEDYALQVKELGYRVRPNEPDAMKHIWGDRDPGMEWGELLRCVHERMRSGSVMDMVNKSIRLTDDNDPHAPWFKIIAIKTDDDGPFFAIEEVEV